MDINSIATNIKLQDDGIYYPKGGTESISYPSEGNDHCFQIEKNSFWFKHRNNIIIDAVKHHCPDNVFFDVGGGNGFVAKGLTESGIEAILVEPGSGTQNAKKSGLPWVICSTLNGAGFRESSLGSVGLFDVVEHIQDDLGFLKEVHRYLKPGGLVFITVPAYKLLWSSEDVYAGHFRRYTLRSMRRVLKNAGFQPVYSTYFFSILPLPILFARCIPSWLGIKTKNHDLNKQLKDHQHDKGLLTRMMDAIWDKERSRLQKGRRIPFGGSCFFIATKP
jgi:SAM-dependent methyltransferase